MLHRTLAFGAAQLPVLTTVLAKGCTQREISAGTYTLVTR